MKLQLRNRFIHVGVDISSYALLIGGRSSYPPVLVKLLYPRSVVYSVSCWSVILYVDYPRHGNVLYGSRIIKTMCVHHLYLQC